MLKHELTAGLACSTSSSRQPRTRTACSPQVRPEPTAAVGGPREAVRSTAAIVRASSHREPGLELDGPQRWAQRVDQSIV